MSKEALKNAIVKNGITYNLKEKETYSSILNFRYKEKNLESMNLEVTLGCYQTDISIFLMNMPHDFSGAKYSFARGAFGQATLIRF